MDKIANYLIEAMNPETKKKLKKGLKIAGGIAAAAAIASGAATAAAADKGVDIDAEKAKVGKAYQDELETKANELKTKATSTETLTAKTDSAEGSKHRDTDAWKKEYETQAKAANDKDYTSEADAEVAKDHGGKSQADLESEAEEKANKKIKTKKAVGSTIAAAGIAGGSALATHESEKAINKKKEEKEEKETQTKNEENEKKTKAAKNLTKLEKDVEICKDNVKKIEDIDEDKRTDKQKEKLKEYKADLTNAENELKAARETIGIKESLSLIDKYKLYQLLESNGYIPSEENIQILTESILND